MDWRNETNYEYTKKLPPEGWAWEFLRRNKEYREDYQNYLSTMPKPEQKAIKRTIYDCNIYDQNPEAYIFTPPLLEGETIREWHSRTETKRKLALETDEPTPTMQHKSTSLGEKWKIIGGIKNPDEIYDKSKIKFDLTFDDQVHKHMNKYFEYIDEDIAIQKTNKSGAIAIGFDLSMPLDNQIHRAKEYLERRKKDFKKSNSKETGFNVSHKWKTYLRILDARLEKTTYEEIGKILYPSFYNHPDSCEVSKVQQEAQTARNLSKSYKSFIKKLSLHKN